MRHLTLLFSIVLLLSGCGVAAQTGNIGVFGEATKGVTDKIDAVITEYNEANIQNVVTKLAQHKKTITIDDFNPVTELIIKEADKKDYALYKANQALGDYALALSGLAQAGSRQEIDVAATKLYGSLQTINSQYKVLKGTTTNLIDDKTSAGLAKVIGEIGNLYIEEKRGEAIKSIVISADKYIQIICDVIIEELLKGTIETRIFTMRNTEISGYIKDYNDTLATSATATFEDRLKSLNVIYKKYEVMQASSAPVAQAINAVKAIKEAHGTIKSDVEKDIFTSKNIVEAVGKLKDINDHYNNIGELMVNCKTQLISDEKKGIICQP